MADLKITDLTETTEAPDTSFIPIDDGETTYKITVGNYNSEANATAKSYAEAAQGYAQAASDAKDLAVGAKNDAELAVSNASDYADAASLSATEASGSATEASGYVGQAQTAASNANSSALAAAASAQNVSDYADLSKSWAQGGTGKRADESVNNAKYWAGVAQGAAGGGVTTFNGRSGVVTSQSGDYDASEIDYDNTTSGLSAIDVQSAIDEVQSEIDGLGSAADKDSTNAVTQGSTDLVESGAVYTGLAGKEDAAKVLPAQTLSVGSTTLAFTDSSIGNNSRISVKSNPFTSGLVNAVQSGTTVTLTFKAQNVALSVTLEVRN